ncbi:helix-turn-helix transcriptional regulator [Streptomyces sp. NPDC047123]|uniref:helix-turn-helix transcriptional regulator n=1 Tax=Streptomyces sp. NPDC047123 TaxID=3155622 RepID=UPI0033D3B533
MTDGAAQGALALLRKELRQARADQGWSIDRLLARTAAQGVPLGRTTVSQALNDGHPRPSSRTVAALARALGVDPAPLHALWERASPRAAPAPAPGPPRAPGAADTGPALLEVHEAPLPGTDPGTLPFLTPYLLRPHDEELRHALAPALAEERSVLLLATGGSSTGKTRALYEALCALAPGRPLLRPHDHVGLLNLLHAGEAGPGQVLWLDEAQRFLHGGPVAEEAAELLRRLLLDRPGVVAAGTLWTEPYQGLVARPDTVADPHGRVRALLTSPATRKVAVPGRLTDAERERWRRLAADSGDPRMSDSLHAGARDGRVVQHLSGGPELYEAFRAGPGAHFSVAEHALVSTALAARGLRHYAPVPGPLLAQAADAVLDARHRSADPDWAAAALRSLTRGVRPDGRRTDIRSTLTALVAVRAAAGEEPAYEPADYLEQALRAEKALPAPTPALWRAVEEHTTDPHMLFAAAQEARWLDHRKQAVLLMRRAIAAGHPHVLQSLMLALPRDSWQGEEVLLWVADHAGLTRHDGIRLFLWSLHDPAWPEAGARIARRAVAQADVTDPDEVAALLSELGQIGQQGLLLARDPVTHLRLPEAPLAARLLHLLSSRGHVADAVRLADRLLPGADLTRPDLTAELLVALRAAGGREADVAAVAREAARHVDPGDTESALAVLDELVEAGEDDAARLFAGRLAESADVADAESVGYVLDGLRACGGMPGAAVRIAERAVERCDLSVPEDVAFLLDGLRAHAVGPALTRPFVREAVGEGDVGDVTGVMLLLWSLRELGETAQAARLLDRAVRESVGLSDPEYAACFLQELAAHGLARVVPQVAERAVEEAAVDRVGVGFLLRELRATDRPELLARLAARCADSSEPRVAGQLRQVGQDACARRVIDRALDRTDLRSPHAPARLVAGLAAEGELDAARRLARAALDADAPSPDLVAALRKAGLPQEAALLERRLADRPPPTPARPGPTSYGLETDGTSAAPWRWSDLPPVDEDWCARARAASRETRWL